MKQLTITNRLTNRETDSFKQYLKDIAEIEIFTPEEELLCTTKAANGDKQAVQELIKRNLRFVVSVAKRYATPANPLEDLVNEGNIGLITAAEKFKPEMGFKFISYAVWWIRKYIYQYLSDHGKVIRFPHNKINSLSKLDKEINRLEQRLGRNVDIQEVIEEFKSELGFDTISSNDKLHKEILTLDSLSSYTIDSLDREINSHDGTHTTLADLIADETTFKSTDHILIDMNMKEEVARIINVLKPRDKRIVIALYGLDGNTPMTLKEIGEEIGITREMVRQIREKTLSTLREKLKNSTIRTY